MDFKPFISKFTFLFPIIYCLMLAGYIGILHLDNGMLFSRVGSISSGHTLVWIIILLFAIYFRLGINNSRPIHNFIKWIATMVFTIAIIECTFQMLFIMKDPFYHRPTFIPIIETLIGLVVGIRMESYKLFDFKWLGFFFIFMVGWFAMGMPLTVSNNTMTEYYYNKGVNMIEILQWFLGLSMFAVGFKFEVDDLWNTHQAQ